MLLRMTSSALALMALSAPAMAAVTPEQVWQDWLDYFQSTGYDVSEGARELAGSTLTLKDVAFALGQDDDTRITFTVPEIKMQETGDGGVRTTYTDQQDLLVTGNNAEDDPFSLTLHLAMPGNEMVSSGEAGDMTHAYNYPEISISVKELTTDNETVELPITFTMTDNSGQLRSAQSGSSEWSIGHKTLNITAKANIDQPEGRFNLIADIEGLEAEGTVTRGEADINIADDVAAALRAGFASAGNVKVGPMKASFDFEDLSGDDDAAKGEATIETGQADAAYRLSRDSLIYQVNTSNLAAEITTSPLPFPIRYGIESSTFDMQLPVSKSDEAQPFKIAYSLAGLSLGDQVWDMLDPARSLNRDPANILLDISGLTRMTKDLLETPQPGESETATEMMSIASESNPFDLVEATLNQFGLNALGAQVHASGEVRPSVENGMEQPVGNVAVNFSGVAELIQTLAQMGLLPPDQVMMVNAMIGMFTVEDADIPGTRKAELEMKEDGSIFANGVQLQ